MSKKEKEKSIRFRIVINICMLVERLSILEARNVNNFASEVLCRLILKIEKSNSIFAFMSNIC